MDEVIKKYENLLIQKRYSNNTINMYCNYFNDYGAKGEKDRISLLSDNLLQILRQYYKKYKPRNGFKVYSSVAGT